MKVEYQTLYKCRFCGQIYAAGCTGTDDIAIKAMTGVVTGHPTLVQNPTLYDTHFCADGSFGLSDFQGFKKVEVEHS